ncbi:hypothetical protein F4782DRAFT_521538 [Xylaria castorea]|nr:hypothetical protein F4782DRAFT_521538 [Xylaria castorea]
MIKRGRIRCQLVTYVILSRSNTNIPSVIHMAKREDAHEELPRCASQDSRAGSHRSSPPTHFELDDLVGTVLGRRFAIGERLRDENNNNNHFVAFAVHQDDVIIRATADGTNGLVARIYDMNDLTPKHKRYKIRSINRSAARTVFKMTWNSCQIIILKLGSLDDPESSTDTETIRFDIDSPKPKTDDEHDHLSLGISEARVASGRDNRRVVSAPLSMNFNITSSEQKLKPNSSPRQKAKTNYQRESSRLRQRDRRATKRCQQRSTNSQIRLDLQPQPPSKIPGLEENIHGLDDPHFFMLMILHFAFNPRQELKMGLPHASRTEVELFLAARSAKVVLSNDDEKLEFVQMKESELVGLRHFTNKLNGFIQHCHDELHSLLEEQRSTMRGSTEWSHLQEKFIAPRKYWYKVLLTVSKVLPRLTTESEELIDSLRSELKEASQLKEKRRILNYKQWIHHLIPGSDTYYQLVHTLRQAACHMDHPRDWDCPRLPRIPLHVLLRSC